MCSRAINQVIDMFASNYKVGQETEICEKCEYQDILNMECVYLRQQLGERQRMLYTLKETLTYASEIPHLMKGKDEYRFRSDCPMHKHLDESIASDLMEYIKGYNSGMCQLSTTPGMYGLCLTCTRAGEKTSHSTLEPCPTAESEYEKPTD